MSKCITTVQFVIRACTVHGNKYDYSSTVYVNDRTKIKVICPEHGFFEPTPNNHVGKRSGCPKCAQRIGRQKRTKTKNQFIVEANKIHNNKYDYSLLCGKMNGINCFNINI